MGTWGAGNFESDGALDFLSDLMTRLTNTINTCFNDGKADLDEGGEEELMPSVAIIKLLAEKCRATPPETDVVESWRKRYLQIYDEQIDDLRPNLEYKTERRKIIDTTFTDLIDLSRQFRSE
jgi:predicted RNase H-like nuclease (RuvC/YqgF family)